MQKRVHMTAEDSVDLYERPSQLPEPSGYRILLGLPEIEKKTEGGVIKPDSIINTEAMATVVAFVIKMGPDCYKDKERFPSGNFCKEGDFVIEIVDDIPKEDAPYVGKETKEGEDDLGDYSKKVQTRIKKLKFDFHEERRAKESSERMREEAIRVAEIQRSENERLKKLLDQGSVALQDVSKKKVESDLVAIQKEYQDAYDAGDSEKMVLVQKKLADATYEQRKIEEAAQNWNNQKANGVDKGEPVAQPQTGQAQPSQPQVDPKAANWLKNNSWFQKPGNEEMTAVAYGYHEKLIRSEGIDPRSDEYYKRIDKRLREVFPNYFEDSEEETTQEDTDGSIETEIPEKTGSKPAPVVASAKRSNSKASRNVKLTKTQVQLARRLGLTNEQYAAQLVKEQANV